MDNSFHRQGQRSDTQQDRKSFLVSLPIFVSVLKWLANLIKLTEEEQENAGVYLGRLGDE
jgi:hypothetical protein